MSKRYMTDGEVVTFFRQAADQKAEIRILAELNNCCTDEIIAILHSRGIKTPRVKRYDPSQIQEYDVGGRRTKTVTDLYKTGRWSEQDTYTIVSMFERGCGYAEIAQQVRRTEGSVKARIWDLRRRGTEIIHARHGAWSADEDRLLIDMCRDGYGADLIADAVGRSKASVKSRMQKLRKEGVQVEYRKKGRNPAD